MKIIPLRALSWTTLIFALFGCIQSSPWQYQEMTSCSPEYISSKLTIPPANHFNGIGIELIKKDLTSGYFNIYNGTMVSDEGIIWINNQPIHFKGVLMEGNQRLLLPAAITRDIILALEKGHSVKASIQGYSTSLDSDVVTAVMKTTEITAFR